MPDGCGKVQYAPLKTVEVILLCLGELGIGHFVCKKASRKLSKTQGSERAFQQGCTRGGACLLAHDDAQTAAPALRQAHACAFQFWNEIPQKGACRGMET